MSVGIQDPIRRHVNPGMPVTITSCGDKCACAHQNVAAGNSFDDELLGGVKSGSLKMRSQPLDDDHLWWLMLLMPTLGPSLL